MVCVLEQCLRNNQAGGNFQCVRSWPRDKLCSEEPESNQLRRGRGTGKRKPQKSSKEQGEPRMIHSNLHAQAQAGFKPVHYQEEKTLRRNFSIIIN